MSTTSSETPILWASSALSSTEPPSDASDQERMQFNPGYITKWIGAGGVLELFPDGTGTMYRISGNTVDLTPVQIVRASGDRMTHIPDLADGGTGNRYTATTSDDGTGLVATDAPLCRDGTLTCTQTPQ